MSGLLSILLVLSTNFAMGEKKELKLPNFSDKVVKQSKKAKPGCGVSKNMETGKVSTTECDLNDDTLKGRVKNTEETSSQWTNDKIQKHPK